MYDLIADLLLVRLEPLKQLDELKVFRRARLDWGGALKRIAGRPRRRLKGGPATRRTAEPERRTGAVFGRRTDLYYKYYNLHW
jgi:hypothetical protein